MFSGLVLLVMDGLPVWRLVRCIEDGPRCGWWCVEMLVCVCGC